MPYVVDTGGETLEEADNLHHALDMAAEALARADECALRLGLAPFYADVICVLRVPEKVWRYDVKWNSRALAEMRLASKQTKDAVAIRKARGMAPCPCPRP